MPFFKLLLFFVFSLLLGCSNSDTAQDYTESGKFFYKQENYEKAKIEFKNAIQADSQQVDALYHLALIYEKEKNGTGMYKKLLQIIQIDPKHIDAHLKLGLLYFLSNTNQSKEALAEVASVLAIDKNNLEALVLKGQILFKQKKMDEAIVVVNKVLSQEPGHVEAIQLEVLIYAEQQDYATALVKVEKALKNNNKNLSLSLIKLQLLKKLNDLPTIEKYYISLIKDFPDKLEFSYDLGSYYSQNKKDDEALAIFEGIVDKNPTLLKPKLVLINFLKAKKPQQAEKKLKEYITQMPKSAELYISLARLYRSQKKPEEVKKQLNLLIQNSDNKHARLNAKILLAAAETDLNIASNLIEEVLAIDEHHFGGLFLKAKLKLTKGLYDETITDLRNILKDYPESDKAMGLLAETYLKKNLPELAQEHYRKTLDINPGNLSAMKFVASQMVDNEDFSRAEKVVQRFLNKNPENTDALLMLTKIKFLLEDWKGTEQIAALLAKKPGGASISDYLAGRVLQEQGLYEQAIKKYKQVLIDSPDLFVALDRIMISYEALKQRPLMHKYLNEYISLHPDKSYAHALQAQLFIFDKDIDKALSILTAANRKWPKSSHFYEKIARVFIIKGDEKKAISILKEGIKNVPNSISLTAGLATLYQNKKDYKSALTLYEEFVTRQPDNNLAINNLASLLLDHFPTTENSKRALKLVEHFDSLKQAFFRDTYGWALFANNRYEEALAVFTDVVSKNPKIAVFRYHLAKTYDKMNNTPKAISEIEQALTLGNEAGNFSEQDKANAFLKILKNMQ
jgi:tetratricopeptide (TPR) repeat protein